MKKLTIQDIANVYSTVYISFKDLDTYPKDSDDNLSPLEQSERDTQPLTTQELIKEYDISAEVADKLIDYQSSLLANYRDSISELLSQVDRYNEIRPYINNRGIDKSIFLQYLTSVEDLDKLKRDFNPAKQLRNGLIGTTTSYLVFFTSVIVGWNVKPPTTMSDFICLGLVAFIWLGITTGIAWQLPSEYRTRKIIYRILIDKHI
jgi:hypothetical protein